MLTKGNARQNGGSKATCIGSPELPQRNPAISQEIYLSTIATHTSLPLPRTCLKGPGENPMQIVCRVGIGDCFCGGTSFSIRCLPFHFGYCRLICKFFTQMLADCLTPSGFLWSHTHSPENLFSGRPLSTSRLPPLWMLPKSPGLPPLSFPYLSPASLQSPPLLLCHPL